jgi:hypothetical protein
MQWKPRFEEFETEGCVIDTSYPLDESLAKVICIIHELHARETYMKEQDFLDKPRI